MTGALVTEISPGDRGGADFIVKNTKTLPAGYQEVAAW